MTTGTRNTVPFTPDPERHYPPGGGLSAAQAGNESERTQDEDKAMALVGMAANFGKELPEALFGMWLDLLAPYPAPVVAEAVKNLVLHYEYKTLPPFALLQKELDALCGAKAGSAELQATAEWGALLTAVRRYGSHTPPKTLHPTTAFVLRLMGGWQAVCRWTEDGLDFKRRDFTRLWLDSHGNVDAMALGAAGLCQAIGGRIEGRMEGRNRAALPAKAAVTALLEGMRHA